MLTSIGQCRVATDVQFIKNKKQDICQVYKTKYACNNVLLTVITMPYIRSRTYYLSTSCKFIIRKKKLQGKTISYLPLRRTVNLCVGFFVAQGMAILVR